MKIPRMYGRVIWLAGLLAWGSASAQTGLSLPDAVGRTGSVLSAPVHLTPSTPIASGQVIIEYDSSVLQFTGARIGPGISGLAIVNTNTSLPFSPTAPGTDTNVLVQFAGAGTVTGSLDVLLLDFTVLGGPGANSPLVFDRGAGRTELVTDNLVTLSAGDLNLTDGQVTASLAGAQIRVLDANGQVGEEVVAQVEISTDLQITVAQVTVDYDSSVLSFAGAETGAATTGLNIMINTSLPPGFGPQTPGTDANVLVQIADTANVSTVITGQDQEAMRLRFTIIANPPGGTTPLGLNPTGELTVLSTFDLQEIFGGALALISGSVATQPTVVPVPSFSPDSLAFGDREVGGTADLTFEIGNIGGADLTVSGISLVNNTDGAFSLLSPPGTPFAIAPAGAAQTLTVRFSPGSAGLKTAAVEIAHNAAGSPSQVSLSGTGTAVVSRFRVAGTVAYFTGDRTVPDVVLTLAGDSSITATTPPDGTYEFTDLAGGNYTVTPSKTTDSGGVNATDALLVVRHTAGLGVFTDPNRLIAGDVNHSGAVNATDALLIVRFTAGLTDAFPAGAWAFAPPNRSYEPLDTDRSAQDHIGIRIGDVNGSWQPDGAVAKPVSPDGGVRVALPDLWAESGTGVEVPVRMDARQDLGAMTLVLGYPAELLTFAGLDTRFPGAFDPVAGQEDGVLRIVWTDMTGIAPVRFHTGSELVLRFQVVDDTQGTGTIRFLDGTELADAVGNVLPIDPADGQVRISRLPKQHALFQNHPNPFNPDTQIEYHLPEAGEVSIVIYNALGQEARTLVRTFRKSGVYRVKWDGRDDFGRKVSSGIYLYRMQSGAFSRTRRMLLLK